MGRSSEHRFVVTDKLFHKVEGFNSDLANWFNFIESAVVQNLYDLLFIWSNLFFEDGNDGIDYIDSHLACVPVLVSNTLDKRGKEVRCVLLKFALN